MLGENTLSNACRTDLGALAERSSKMLRYDASFGFTSITHRSSRAAAREGLRNSLFGDQLESNSG